MFHCQIFEIGDSPKTGLASTVPGQFSFQDIKDKTKTEKSTVLQTDFAWSPNIFQTSKISG